MPDAPREPIPPGGTISVIVPSWRRPADLDRCLRALAAQCARPADVVVGARVGDDETTRVAQEAGRATGLKVTVVGTDESGVIAAMNAAVGACHGDIIALTDDDAEPRPDWTERLVAAFADPRVGGVGGRDWQPLERGDRTDVGRVQWFGRVIGNHHLGAGPARPVDVLKGANIAIRAPLLAAAGFDVRLRGAGAQMFWEMALCLPIRRAGWTLIYDPAIAVDHHIAVRHDADQRHRGVFVAGPQVDAVHNATLILLEHLGGAQRLAFLVWAFLFGTRIEPGLLQIPRLLVTGDGSAFAKWRSTVAGRRAGLASWRAGRAVTPARIPSPPSRA